MVQCFAMYNVSCMHYTRFSLTGSMAYVVKFQQDDFEYPQHSFDLTIFNILYFKNMFLPVIWSSGYIFLYRVRIQAVNDIGVGAFSPVTKFTTRALPPRPPRLECNGVAHNFLKLKWSEGRNNMDLNTFTLEMDKDDGKYGHLFFFLTHSHTMTPFDASGKQAFW